jgi:ketosteroid isomerase-like protein
MVPEARLEKTEAGLAPAGEGWFVLNAPEARWRHREGRGDFLVLSGEALLIVEGQERPLRQWDFVHCPPETRHMIVGAGDGLDLHMEWAGPTSSLGSPASTRTTGIPIRDCAPGSTGREHWRAEADDYLELGNHVVVLASYHGRGKGSGVEIYQQGAHVFELRDGKVVRLEIFANREKAIESVHSARSDERDRVG